MITTLTYEHCALVSGGELTDKQAESLVAKTSGYAFRAAFLGALAAAKFIPSSSFLVGGVAGPFFSVVGTYLFYENQDYVMDLLAQTKAALPTFFKSP